MKGFLAVHVCLLLAILIDQIFISQKLSQILKGSTCQNNAFLWCKHFLFSRNLLLQDQSKWKDSIDIL